MCIIILAFAKDYRIASILIIIAEGLAGLSTAGIYKKPFWMIWSFSIFVFVENWTIIASFDAIHNDKLFVEL